MQAMLETTEAIRDMIAELAAWLKEPPPSDLADLIKVLIVRSEMVSEQIVQVRAKLDRSIAFLRARTVLRLPDQREHIEDPEQDTSLTAALLLFDEFAQLRRMDRLAHALQYVRGYGMRIALVVQNRAQIMDVYGAYAATDVFDNVGCEMVYGTGDGKLADQLETGERNLSYPIGSCDFCPRPNKSASVAWAFANPVGQAKS
jgi:hypothetical protein